MSAFKYFTKIDVKHVRPVEGYCQSAASGTGAKMTEVEARVALVCASTDDSRPLTDCENLLCTVVDWVAGHA